MDDGTSIKVNYNGIKIVIYYMDKNNLWCFLPSVFSNAIAM